MEIFNAFDVAAIEQAASVLRSGGVVAFPTETVYGLGADAFNARAVARIFEIKKRPRFDPLIVHVARKEWVFDIAEHVAPQAVKMIDRFWPGPLTIILKKQACMPDIVTAGLPTVGVRMPSHPAALALIEALGHPIAAPSANPFGYISPTRARHVAKMFRHEPGIILDGGNSRFGIESTIVSVRDGTIVLHRHGAIPVEDLCSIGETVREKTADNVCEAPGELPYHYAPMKPLKIIDNIDEITVRASSYLGFRETEKRPPSRYVKYLSHDGDMREAATNFFSHLIELDRQDVDVIYAERIPEQGLGKAMMERLAKAAKKCTP
ncbi:MAG: Threonylcarbamoyl-AMP synthase [Syntrophorhabdus sp. PtaU1.Bin050]|jgi:L-threonylcarbamoyladenylate synthase|nr:MAG: Threonylcarbamoyl-AMP synthase [Syntrophorhabdus sp. PtaU1.Bin050]